MLGFAAVIALALGSGQIDDAPEGSPADDTTAPVEATARIAAAERTSVVDPDADKEICKRFREIGSRIAHRKVCKTKAEWDNDREANADALRNPRGAGGPQLGNGG